MCQVLVLLLVVGSEQDSWLCAVMQIILLVGKMDKK